MPDTWGLWDSSTSITNATTSSIVELARGVGVTFSAATQSYLVTNTEGATASVTLETIQTLASSFGQVAYALGYACQDTWGGPATITGAPFVPRKKTAAEIQAELRYRAWRDRCAAERAAAELAAKLRAEKLLLDNLNAEQRDSLKARGCFYLYTKSGKRYRIDRHTHGNIKLVDATGSIKAQLCAQPGGVPVDDAILAQKLALETDEDAFLKVANVTRYG